MVQYKDYYQVLGVAKTATDQEIKSAYRKMARKYHPDTNKGDPTAEDRIKEINEAYEVLKDQDKRQKYDQLGSNWKAGDQFKPPPDYSGFSFDFGNMGGGGSRGNAGGMGNMGGMGGASFSDFFETLFGQTFGTPGGGGPGGRGPQPGAGAAAGAAAARKRSLDQEADIELVVEELAQGARRTLQVTAQGGKSKTIEVKIPKGMRAGKKVRVPGEGATIPGGSEKGDLYLRIKVKPHKTFTIDGDNLVCELSISPAQAVVGSEVSVSTIEGPVTIKVPAGTQNGRMLRLKGKGLPTVDNKVTGDLLVRTRIAIPTTVSEKEKALYEQLAALEKEKKK
ncbi:MAG: J domain-containing protein [Cyanobacteria bacterium REEB67]|nr:J domain-containing protein [Cyanobacteria bacterium REEB67]